MSTIKLFTLPAVFLLFTSALTLNSQWTFCPGSTNMTGLGTYPTVSVVNANTVYIAGGTSTAKVYRSIDGGSNFVNITGNLTGPELSGVCGVSDQIAMVCDGASPNAKIYRTTNGGVNWTMMVSTPTGVGFFNGIVRSILIPNFIYAMSDAPLGAGFFIAVSTNAGAIWKTTTPNAGSGSIATFGSLYCVDSLFYGFGHWTAPRYAYTTNAGTNWTVQTLTVLGLGGTAAFNSDKLKGIFATSYCLPQINFTTNGPGGLLSTMNIGGGGGEFPVLRFGGSSNFCFVAVGSGVNPIRMSTNSGDGGWSQMTTAGITGFSDMSFVSAGTELFGYAVSTSGNVIKLHISLVGIEPANNEIPNSFALAQNYPNPFNPATNIKFSIPTAGLVKIAIYDVLGNQVAVIINENLNAGNYKIDFNAYELSSGIYFYKMFSGEFKETKKMILIK